MGVLVISPRGKRTGTEGHLGKAIACRVKGSWLLGKGNCRVGLWHAGWGIGSSWLPQQQGLQLSDVTKWLFLGHEPLVMDQRCTGAVIETVGCRFRHSMAGEGGMQIASVAMNWVGHGRPEGWKDMHTRRFVTHARVIIGERGCSAGCRNGRLVGFCQLAACLAGKHGHVERTGRASC